VGSAAGTLTLSDSTRVGQQTVALSGMGTADFSLSVASGSSNSVTVTAGSAATYNLDVNPLGGLKQTVLLTCSDTVPLSQCTVAPTRVVLDGTNSAGFAVKVTTMAPSFAPLRWPGDPAGGERYFVVLLLLAMLAAMGAAPVRGKSVPSRFAASLGLLALTFMCLVAMNSCGAKSGSLGTPKQSYTLTVSGVTSASPKIQHAFNLTLVVN
jgi:hypothetical protein